MSQSNKAQGVIIGTADVAAEAGVSKQTVRNWIESGFNGRRLVAAPMGRRWKINRADWESFKRHLRGEAEGEPEQ